MNKLYFLLSEGSEWEDIIVYNEEIDAVEASIIHPEKRVEIFVKNGNCFKPTYTYFKNGKFIK